MTSVFLTATRQALIAAALCVPAWVSAAPQISLVHGFNFNQSGGTNPTGKLLLASDGAFYGTASSNGPFNGGGIYRISAGVYAPLFDFNPGFAFGGGAPRGALVEGRDGNLYGTTQGGGLFNCGTFFKITKAGSLTTLYSFKRDDMDPCNPNGSLVIGPDGQFYGASQYGGPPRNGFGAEGAVFKFTSKGVLTLLHGFTPFAEADPAGGANPLQGVVVDAAGTVYGTANGGLGYGVVYKIPPGGDIVYLHKFERDGRNGEQPDGELFLAKDGALYGTTSVGGAYNQGTVFRITTSGVFKTLYSFRGLPSSDGSYPSAQLAEPIAGTLVGTTQFGGSADKGTIFKIGTNGKGYQLLHSFAGYPTDGALPQGGVIVGKDGLLWGNTFYGGDPAPSGGCGGCGVVYKWRR